MVFKNGFHLHAGIKGLLVGVVMCLSACGGGGGGAATASGSTQSTLAEADSVVTAAGVVYSTAYTVKDYSDAARFLTQATFGPTQSDIASVTSMGKAAWIDAQLSLPLTKSHVQIARERNAASGGKHQLNHSFWQKALSSPDQLRQRVAFALSQILVVSLQDTCAAATGLGMNSYYDLLTDRAFGSYRDLLEAVSRHPIMGCYLSHLRNQKGDPTTGRVPDENYAREVMQLFSIGLVQLNMDGTPKLDASGQQIETYSARDISEMARVFTGFSWDCPKWPADFCFRGGNAVARTDGADVWTLPMMGYPNFHDSAEKTVLGKKIPASNDPLVTLRGAIDILATHPNLAPFISKQLIQRLVTSNPSPAYVQRIATVFRNTNGNIGTTVKAILLDGEAMNYSASSQSATAGKVREPVLRMSAMLRAFNAKSDSGAYLIGSTREDAYGLAQSVLHAPSVFNFYRPGYTPPGSKTASAGMLAPELQIAHETSVAGYASYVRDTIWAGIGMRGYDGTAPRSDVTMEVVESNSALRSLADNPASLVDMVDKRLTWGRMSPATKALIVDAVSKVDFVSKITPTEAQAQTTKAYRLYSAILLAMVSPDFVIQK